MIEFLGFAAAVALPFWNIPLILTLQKRRSSKDISLSWALGVLACLILMLPSGLRSADPVFRVFCVMNAGMFAIVTAQVLRFRR